MRICIAAEHASEQFGGEAFLPVHYFRLLRARGIDVWLVVHSRTQGELEKLFPNDLDRILFVQDLWIHKFLARVSNWIPRRLSVATFGMVSQLITQICQRNILRDLIRNNKIDVVHQPIPISPRFPSALYSLNVPVIIGPMNGGMEYPPAFRREEPRISRAAIAFLHLFENAGNRLLPGKREAAILLIANERTRMALPSGVSGKVIEMNENGIDIELWQSTSEIEPGSKPLFVFVGRLVDWKALDIVIRALKDVPAAELEVVGDGPMLEPWKKLAEEVGVAERIHFAGRRSQPEYASSLRACTALVLPSLYESGGAVVLEAMASGRAVIATCWGGPTDYLDETCGILVEPDSYPALVNGFAAAMRRLLEDPDLAKSMGAAGRERAVRDFDWKGRIDRVVDMYRALTENSEVLWEYGSGSAVTAGHIRTQPRDASQFRMKMTN